MSFSIFPRTVYKTESKISGEIEVKEQFGRYTLHVQDLIQSGGIVKGIWEKALRQAQGKLSVSNCLILGLGGGTVVQLIKARYPEAKIIGIEIDPEIIKIGKKFFGLGEIKNLEIINADAIKWVETKGTSEVARRDSSDGGRNRRFNLIIVDLYIGGKFPQEIASDEFLKKLKKLLSKEGVIIFNWLKNGDEKEFIEKIERNFSKLEELNTRSNLFLFAH